MNLCTGNLFKSFTDIQVAPARGAGLVLQRTYNSNDDRIGPFGVGWTHAYDIRMTEENPDTNQTADALNVADRVDFFGGRHKYHRDADGLYSPPAYLYDETESEYDTALINGPIKSLSDTEIGMDGTVKHFVRSGTNVRVCDSITDRYGNATLLDYDAATTLPDGSHPLFHVTDPSGRTLTFHWQNLGTQAQPAYRIMSVDGPLYSVSYEYNSDLNLWKTHRDPTGLNRTTTFGYTSYTDTAGTETGLLASITDPLGHTVSYQYGIGTRSTGTLWVTQVTEPASVNGVFTNQVWTVADWSNSSPSEVENYQGVTVLVFGTTAPGATINVGAGSYSYGVTAYSINYDASYNLTSLKRRGFWQDPNNRAAPQPLLADPVQQNSTFGAHGNVLTSIFTSLPGQTATGYYNASQYFQKSSVTDMNGHGGTLGVGTKSAGTSGDADTNPGDRGSVLWVRDAGYNVAASPSYQKQFTYTYNQYGQKTSETNLNGAVTTYTYGDQWGNLTQVVQDAGTGKLNRTTTMVYDAGGRVTQSTDPMGRTSTFTYNVLGQPLTVSTPATSSTPAETITYTYGLNGRTDTVTDGRGTTTMAYEPGCDRVASVTDPVTGTLSYTYGLNGERRTMTLPGGGVWTYGYQPWTMLPNPNDLNSASLMLNKITDDQGRVVEVFLDGTSGAVREAWSNETYDSSGNLVSFQKTHLDCDQSAPDGQGTVWSHGWLKQTTTTWNWRTFTNGQPNPWQSRVLSQNVYTHDNAGQRQSNQVTLSNYDGTSSTTRTEAYGYDELNRLTSVDYGDGQTQVYAFDAMGNRTNRNDSVAGNTISTFDAANRLLTAGGNTYTNDANGNTLTGGGRTMTWDGQNRMVSCVSGSNTSTFTYGADGLRRRSTVNGTATDFVLDGQSVVQEKRAGSVYAVYFTGAQGPAYRRDASGVARWYVYDGLGSVAGEVDPNGNMTASSKYDVYGGVRSSTGTRTTSHGFVGALGHPSEAETGLIYMRARYYDPNIGRFASQDPKRNGDNWFIYVNNNMDCTLEVRQTVKVVHPEREPTDYEPQAPHLYQRVQAASPA